MTTKISIEIESTVDASTALSVLSGLLDVPGYKVSVIKASPANALKMDSKDIPTEVVEEIEEIDLMAIARNQQIQRIENNNKR